VGSSSNISISNEAELIRDQYPGICVHEYFTTDLDEHEKCFQDCLKQVTIADLVILRLHGGAFYFKKCDRFIIHVKENRVNLFLKSNIPEDMNETKDLFLMPERERSILDTYLELGGKENEAAVVLWAIDRFLHLPVNVPEPKRPRSEGLYHPDMDNEIDLDRYLASHVPDHPTIGVLFHQMLWLSKDLEGIDALIRKLEELGNNTIPVFFSSAPSDITGSIGVRGTIEKYFISIHGSRIDALILNTGFSQLNLSEPGNGETSIVQKENFFATLNVPVLQVMNTYQTQEAWSGNDNGLTFFEHSVNVVWPESDGQIITFPMASTEAGSDGHQYLRSIPDRTEKIAAIATYWAKLRRTPVEKRKVAILLHQNPPRNDAIGDAFGLDAPMSTVSLLKALQEHGYRVDRIPEDGNDLVREILSGITNDSEWLTPEQMRLRAAATVSKEEYMDWFMNVPEPSRNKMIRDWGDPPGELYSSGDTIVIPGVINGNIFIGLQPPRSDFLSSEANYHNLDLVVPHNYLAYYRWIEKDFSANAIIHMGCHGTHEWLPGKSVGLSQECYPDLVLDDLPNLYPYIIGNPGEGIQAKRRGYAVIIDHLPPSLTRSDLYPGLSELESDIQAYMHAKINGELDKASDLLKGIQEAALKSNILQDIGLSNEASMEQCEKNIARLYDYLSEVKDSLIKDGLHIFGSVPEGTRLEEMIYAITRLSNGVAPSLREGIAHGMGLDIKTLQENPSEIGPVGVTNGALIDKMDGLARNMIRNMRELGFDTASSLAMIEKDHPGNVLVRSTVIFICETLVPNIRRSSDEISSCLNGLNGEYVQPGPSGVISRGNAHILPTGKNFFSIDPEAIPTAASWVTGKKMAEQMVDRHIKECGGYPENVGIVIFATDTMKTGGDDIAYVLWLMGLRPKWASKGGKVLGLDVIPIKELGRPRIDVTLRISGLFRDSFPGLMDLIDEGVSLIADQDESEEENFLKKHLRTDMVDSIKAGLTVDESKAMALIRIFGDPPRSYGGGVDKLIETSKWSNTKDLGATYVEWGGHAYGKGKRGEKAQESFAKRLAALDVTVKNQCSRELDILDNDDDYIFHGGMVAAAKTFGDKSPISMVGDGADPERTKVRTVAEEAGFIFRSRVLNPKWVEGLKVHGYRGARELSSLVDFVFGWDATSDVIEPWMYEGMADRFLFDKDNKEWLEQNNPDAIKHMSGRLLEAIDRGLWDANDETREKLESIYLEQEGRLEGDEGE
jgi:cobaltochelatase CobN